MDVLRINRLAKITIVYFVVLLQISCVGLPRGFKNPLDSITSSGQKKQQAKSGSARKAWTSQEATIKNVDGLPVVMRKRDGRNPKSVDFIMSAGSRRHVSGIFRGRCEKLMGITITAYDTNRFDPIIFYESGEGRDLPAEVKKVLKAMRITLLEQCEQVEAIRLEYQSVVFKTRGNQNAAHEYKGTLLVKNGWRLQDGALTTGFDEANTIEISFRDLFSVVGVKFKGVCRKNPIILLEPQFANNSERRFHKPPTITDYQRNAESFANKYAAKCPATKTIKFTVNPIPEDRKCDKKNDCFIIASKIGSFGWNMDSDRYKYFDPHGPVKSFAHVTKFLAAGDFKTLERYVAYFREYYQTFVESYSDNCRANITDPVAFDYDVYEVKRNRFSKEISRKKVGDTVIVRVERKYARHYSLHGAAAFQSGVLGVVGQTLENRNKGAGVGQDFTKAFSRYYYDADRLHNSIRGNCGNRKIQAAYKNMLKFADMF